jgi:hypothetical protein
MQAAAAARKRPPAPQPHPSTRSPLQRVCSGAEQRTHLKEKKCNELLVLQRWPRGLRMLLECSRSTYQLRSGGRFWVGSLCT